MWTELSGLDWLRVESLWLLYARFVECLEIRARLYLNCVFTSLFVGVGRSGRYLRRYFIPS
jgi:hypothetical protein